MSNNDSIAPLVPAKKRTAVINEWDLDSGDDLEDELNEELGVLPCQVKKELADDDTSIQILTALKDGNGIEEELKEGMEDYLLLDTGLTDNVSHS
jgi:hypothetical protein